MGRRLAPARSALPHVPVLFYTGLPAMRRSQAAVSKWGLGSFTHTERKIWTEDMPSRERE